MDLASLTCESARALTGTAFRVTLTDGAVVTLTLDEVLAFASRERPGAQESTTLRRDPFALHFLGPRSPILPQAIYTLSSDAARLDLFIVPVGQTSAGTRYEAVFT